MFNSLRVKNNPRFYGLKPNATDLREGSDGLTEPEQNRTQATTLWAKSLMGQRLNNAPACGEPEVTATQIRVGLKPLTPSFSARVAQLDRAVLSEGTGRWCDSSREHHFLLP